MLGTIQVEVCDTGTDEEELNPGDMFHITTQDADGLTKVILSLRAGNTISP